MRLLVFNGPIQTTAKPAPVTTGTSIKTLLQVKPGATVPVKIKGWGISFNGSAAATPISVELIETDVAATVTAFAAADISKKDSDALAAGDVTTALIAVGTTSSGYTASGEGSITSVRNLDAPQQIAPTSQFIRPFAPGDEPVIQAGKFGRIRVHAPAAVDAICWMELEIG